jgi:hypothetical protein
MKVLFRRDGGGICFPFNQWKAQGAFLLFLLSLGGGKGFFFFIFPCFSMCSHGVPSKFLMTVHLHVLYLSTSLLFHMLWPKLFSFHLYAGLKGGTIYIKTEPSILRRLHSLIFLGGSNGPIRLACRLPPPSKRTRKVLCVYTNTSLNHHCTIHWMRIVTQLWMNLNWVNIWFHLGNQFRNK